MSDSRFRVVGRVSGTVSLAAGSIDGTVTLDLDEAPTTVFLTVETDDGSVIWPTLDGDTRTDGFDYSLSAAPEGSGSKLHYVCDF